MKIYILEHRMFTKPFQKDFDHIVSYVASNMEKIHEFMSKNKDYAPDRIRNIWWWAVYGEELDSPLDDDGMETIRYDDMEIYDWDGNSLCGYQPIYGYEDVYKSIEEDKEELKQQIANGLKISKEFLR